MNILLYLAIVVFWGGSYLGIRFVVEALPPFFSAACRIGLALPWLVLLALRTHGSILVDGRIPWRAAIAGTLSMGVAWGLLFWGEQHVAPAVAAIMTAAAPIFATLFLPWYDAKAHYTLRQWVGVAAGFAGILIVFVPRLGQGPHSELAGLLAVLGTTILYGTGIALTSPLTKVVPTSVLSAWQVLPSFCLLSLLSWWTESWPTPAQLLATPKALIALCYLSFCSTVLAILVWFRLLRNVGAVTASTALYFVPLVSLLLDACILRQVPPPSMLLGAAVILCGAAITGAHVAPSSGKVTDAFPACLAPLEPVCPETPPSRSLYSLDRFPRTRGNL